MSEFHDIVAISLQVVVVLAIPVWKTFFFVMRKIRNKASASGNSTIIDWYVEFKHGHTITNGSEGSGHLRSQVVQENIKK